MVSQRRPGNGKHESQNLSVGRMPEGKEVFILFHGFDFHLIAA
jgi:hypothetical protein